MINGLRKIIKAKTPFSISTNNRKYINVTITEYRCLKQNGPQITKCGLVEVVVALFEKCVTVVVGFLLKVCFCDKSFTVA